MTTNTYWEVHRTMDDPITRCRSADAAHSMASLEFGRIYEWKETYSVRAGKILRRSRIVADYSDPIPTPLPWSEWA